MQLRLKQLTPGVLIVSLISLLALLPSFYFVWQHDLMQWGLSISFFLLQFFFLQLYLLETKHDHIHFVSNGFVLIAVECAIAILLSINRDALGGLGFSLLMTQWLLVHLVLLTQQLVLAVTIITFSLQLLFMQSAIEYTQTHFFLSFFQWFPILLNLSLACFTMSFFHNASSPKIHALIFISGLALAILWLIAALFTQVYSIFFILVMVVLFIIFISIAIYCKSHIFSETKKG